MRILVAFATTEGHTRKLAEFIGDRLSASGHRPFIHEVAGTFPLDLTQFDVAILAASLHVGRYQTAFLRFVRAHRAELESMPTAFVSVSLAAAGDNARDWAGLYKCVTRLERQTGWQPDAVAHVAGGMKFSTYGFLTKLIIGRIARKRGLTVNLAENYDLTDYAAFGAFIDQVVRDATPAIQPVAAAQ